MIRKILNRFYDHVAAEVARELEQRGFSEPLRIAKYGFNLTQRGVVFSCFKDLVCKSEGDQR